MELKPKNGTGASVPKGLLIAPYGIETRQPVRLYLLLRSTNRTLWN